MEALSLKEGGPQERACLPCEPVFPPALPVCRLRLLGGFSGAYITRGVTTTRSSQADEGAGPPCWEILEGKAGAVTPPPQLCNLKQVIQTF